MINKSLKLINIGNLVSYNSKKDAMASKKDLEIVIKNEKIVKREKILDNIGRVRDVAEGPDGYLYVAVEGKGILKIMPK